VTHGNSGRINQLPSARLSYISLMSDVIDYE